MGTNGLTVRITHPFHPLTGQTFEVVSRGGHWGEERVIYRGADGRLPSIAVTLTDFAPPDTFCRVAAGRAAFRMIDLSALTTLLDQIEQRLDAGDA